MGRWRAILALLALGALVALALATRSSEAQTPSAAAVRIPFPRDDGTLTPYTFELGYPLVTLIYDTLMWRDTRGVPRPWLARSVRRSGDGRVVTVRLRSGVRWHDGTPLTASDVVFTFGYVQRRFHPRFTPEVRNVEAVNAPDPLTVTFRLRQPSLGFFDQPLADVPIMPRHLWDRLPPGRSAPEGLPVGSGPYRLVRHRPGSAYRFEANDRYFRGRPRVRAIRVPIIRDAQRTFRALDDGRVDMLPVTLPEDAVQMLDQFGIRISEGPSYLGTVLMFNLRRPPLDRPRVRQALASALDLGRIASALQPPVERRTVPADRGYLHPASPWASKRALHRFDQDAARRVLAFVDLPVLRVLAPRNDPIRNEAGRQVVLAMRRVGVQARLEERSAGAVARAMGQDGWAPTFQAAISSAPALASYDPDFLRSLFGSDRGGAPLNYSGYVSARFDRLAERAAAAPSTRARRRAVADQLRLLAADAPVVPLFFYDGIFAYRPGVYDDWVYVRGSGIFDKRSFLPRRGERPSAVRQGSPLAGAADADDSGFPLLRLFVFVGLGLVAVAVAWWLRETVRARRR